MKKILLLSLLAILIMLPDKLAAQDMATKKSVCGSWLGKLSADGMDLRVIFNLKLSEKDSLTVTLDSPDQGASGIPAGPVILDKQKIVIQAPGINGEYTGTIKGDSLLGTWTQNGGSLPLNLKKQTTPAEATTK
jgi:uncharacterized protein